MRPDQQHGEKPAGVLGVLASIWSVGLVGENVNDFEQARDAVAEYIEANDEYDAAQVTLSLTNIHGGMGDGAIRAACRALARADLRRAAAHARMKGETK